MPFFEIKTWIQILAVFVIVKIICWYLAWFYHDKDKRLRDELEQAYAYLSKHSYFEIMRIVFKKLYNRLSAIFERPICFVYLFLIFFLLNLISLWLGIYLIGIDRTELTSLADLYESFQRPEIIFTGKFIGYGRSLVSVFQLTLLDIFSFLFSVGIIYMASRSKGFILLLIELITDISLVALYFVILYQCLYYWLVKNIVLSTYGSFELIMLSGFFISLSYSVFMYFEHRDPEEMIDRDEFALLSLPLLLFTLIFIILHSALWIIFSIKTDSPFYIVWAPTILPIIVLWCFRLFKPIIKSETTFFFKFIMILGLVIVPFWCIGGILLFPSLIAKFYFIFKSASTSNFLFLLVISSILPTLAHLFALIFAIIAKTTPKFLQQFINHHLRALSMNDKKILDQIGNFFGGIAALITAITKLI